MRGRANGLDGRPDFVEIPVVSATLRQWAMNTRTGHLCLCGLLCAVAAVAELSPSRTWTSRRGSKIEAELVQYGGSTVILKRQDGKQMRISIALLCDEDQAFLETLGKERESKAGKEEEELTSIFLSSSKDKEEADEEETEKKEPEEAEADAAVNETPGKISGVIPVPPKKKGDDSKYSYVVYLPKAFTRDRAWPVLFAMSPWGARAEFLKPYIAGAERNGWVVAMSGEAQQSMPATAADEAVLAMVDGVIERFPVDENRLYASGFASGCDQAYRLSKNISKKSIAGIVACGGGPIWARTEVSKKTIVYGLCGTSSPRRWEMACSFDNQLKGKKNVLKFFPGGYDWAAEAYLTDAMTWLNCCYLEDAPRTDKLLAAEKGSIVKLLAELVKERVDTDPGWAYDWATHLGGVTRDADTRKELTKLLQGLKQKKEVKTHIAATEDIDRFVDRYFATSPYDHQNAAAQKKIERAAGRLKEEYKDTDFESFFMRLGQRPAM